MDQSEINYWILESLDSKRACRIPLNNGNIESIITCGHSVEKRSQTGRKGDWIPAFAGMEVEERMA